MKQKIVILVVLLCFSFFSIKLYQAFNNLGGSGAHNKYYPLVTDESIYKKQFDPYFPNISIYKHDIKNGKDSIYLFLSHNPGVSIEYSIHKLDDGTLSYGSDDHFTDSINSLYLSNYFYEDLIHLVSLILPNTDFQMNFVIEQMLGNREILIHSDTNVWDYLSSQNFKGVINLYLLCQDSGNIDLNLVSQSVLEGIQSYFSNVPNLKILIYSSKVSNISNYLPQSLPAIFHSDDELSSYYSLTQN